MSQAIELTDYYLQSTNMDHNALHDVTRGDLVDIIEKLHKVSKIDTIAELLDLIVKHTNGYGVVDPHETTTDQLILSVIDSVYSYWLKQGYTGSIGDFKDTIYRYYRRSNKFMLYTGNDDHNVTTVKVVHDYLEDSHNKRISDYSTLSTFAFSEKASRWPGVLSGIQIRSDENTEFVSEIRAIDPALFDFVSVYKKALEGYTFGEQYNDTYFFIEIYETAYADISSYDNTLGKELRTIYTNAKEGIINENIENNDSQGFVKIYNDAYTGTTEETYTDDSYSFVLIYEAYVNGATSDNAPTPYYGDTIATTQYTDDDYGWLSLYNSLVGNLGIMSDEFTYYFGVDYVDLVEAYYSTLQNALDNLPGYNGTLPDDIAVPDPNLYIFSKYYSEQLGDSLNGLPSGDTSTISTIAHPSRIDTIVDMYFSNTESIEKNLQHFAELEDTALINELIQSLNDPDNEADLVGRFDTYLSTGLSDIGYTGTLPSSEELKDLDLETYTIPDVYDYYLGDITDLPTKEDLPPNVNIDISANDFGLDNIDEILSLYIDETFGLGAVLAEYMKTENSLAKQVEQLLGNATADLVNTYNTALGASLNGIVGWDGKLPLSSELDNIDKDSTSMVDVYMTYLQDGYLNLPAGDATWGPLYYSEDMDISDYYLSILNDSLEYLSSSGLGIFVDMPVEDTNHSETIAEIVEEELASEDPWADKSLLGMSDEIALTISPLSNGDIWYQWHLSVPKTLVGAQISISVEATRSGVLKYRLSDTTEEWKPFSGILDIDDTAIGTHRVTHTNEFSDVADYRYMLPKNIESIITTTETVDAIDTIEYDFRVEFGSNTDPVTISDIITVIDASDILNQLSVPHMTKWYEYFSSGTVTPTPTFAWYKTISVLEKSTDVSWFKNTGGFYIAAQLYPNILTTSTTTFPATVRTRLCSILGTDDDYLEIYSLCTGYYTEPHPSDTSGLTSLTGVQIGIAVSKHGHITDLTSENFIAVNRPIYRLYITYDLYTSTFSIQCQTSAYTPENVDNTENLTGFSESDALALLQDTELSVDLVDVYMESLDHALDHLPAYTYTLPDIEYVPDPIRDTYVFTEYYNKYFDTNVNTLPTSGMIYSNITGPDTNSQVMIQNADGTYSFRFDITDDGSVFTGDSSITPIQWSIDTPANIETGVGVYELVYYPKKIEDAGTIIALIHTDIQSTPYIR